MRWLIWPRSPDQSLSTKCSTPSMSIKLDALPFQKYGSLQGKVLLISEDTVKAEDGKSEPTYRIKVEITERDLRSVPENFRLIPGMTGTAEITVGKRKVISYFVYPIARALDNSFKEP